MSWVFRFDDDLVPSGLPPGLDRKKSFWASGEIDTVFARLKGIRKEKWYRSQGRRRRRRRRRRRISTKESRMSS